jgi:serine/threonine protein kinase
MEISRFSTIDHTQARPKPLLCRPSSQEEEVPSTEIELIKLIGKSKYPVYLACSMDEFETPYALKAFPYINNKPDHLFYTETMFAKLSHQNIVKIVDYQQKIYLPTKSKPTAASYILMELATHGDFADLVLKGKFPKDDILIRTYFHQLLDGIEYLHKNRIAHLDIKPDNLLLSEDFTLKIGDFDSAIDVDLTSPGNVGTKNYRAPELITGVCLDPFKADIYSAAIFLFILKAGIYPYAEGALTNGHDLQHLLVTANSKFWECHPHCVEHSFMYGREFKELVLRMTECNPRKRMSIEEVKKSSWYNGPTYDKKELFEVMSKVWRKN